VLNVSRGEMKGRRYIPCCAVTMSGKGDAGAEEGGNPVGDMRMSVSVCVEEVLV